MSSWSWTRLNTLLQCELSHDLQYNVKVKGRQKQDIYIVGRVVHNVIHAWAKTGFDDAAIDEAVNKALVGEIAGLQRAERTKAVQMMHRAAEAAIMATKLYRKLEIPDHGAIIEERFSIPFIPNERLNGAPDAYDPVLKRVIDLKTQMTGSGKPGQLYTYALSERLLGREVTEGVFVYPTQKVALEYIPISSADIDRQLEIYKEAAANNGKNATKGSHCFFCPFENTKHCTITFNKARATFRPAANFGGLIETEIEEVLNGAGSDYSDGAVEASTRGVAED